jgi:hypothetical protein
MVERSLELTLRKGWVFFLRILGVALVIIGLITAALNITLAGFTPILWILLALASFLGVICNSLFRIVINLEKKAAASETLARVLTGTRCDRIHSHYLKKDAYFFI